MEYTTSKWRKDTHMVTVVHGTKLPAVGDGWPQNSATFTSASRHASAEQKSGHVPAATSSAF